MRTDIEMEASSEGSNQQQEERLLALRRLLESNTFSSSESSRRILKYIVESSISGNARPIKEYTIATEALECPEAFNPKADNRVRVQMQRLRRKLDEYYTKEGLLDPIRISIPIGHYTPRFDTSSRARLASKGSEGIALRADTALPVERSTGPFSLLGWKGFVLLLTISIGVFGASIFRSSGDHVRSVPEKPMLPSSLNCLWKPFLSTRQPPLIIYSNGLFLMSNEGDLYRYSEGTADPLPTGAEVPSFAGLDRAAPIPRNVGPLYYADVYTGTGEVVAAARVAQLLADEGENFDIKRDREVSYEDIRGSNVIFLGANLEDSVLKNLPVEGDLLFERAAGAKFVGSLEIRDLHPSPGQPSVYKSQRDAKTGTRKEEYALISLLPGMTPDHYIMVLAGLSTIGTKAAAEFACSKDCMETITRFWKDSPDKSGISNYFQLLLHVQIRDGTDVRTNCSLVRKLNFRR